MLLLPLFPIHLFFLLLPHPVFQVAGYSFELASTPTQCGTLTVNLTQGQGTPPYNIIVSPIGASSTTPDKRDVLSTKFNGDSVTLQLTYPANSNFIIAVGDTNGIGTGGTTGILNVESSNDDSCLPAATDPEFFFQLIPNSITQCQSTMFAWNTSTVQGTVSMQLLIQHGISETLPLSAVPSSDGLATFEWLANVPVGTLYVLVAGDDRGFGNGGTVTGSIGNNPSGDGSCIAGGSPSVTPQPPPGAVATQTTSGSNTSPSSPSPSTKPSSGLSSKDSIIIGSAVGGGAAVIIFVLSFLVCMRRNRRKRQQRRLDMTEPTGFVPEAYEVADPYIIPVPSTSHSGSFSPLHHEDIPGSSRFSRVQDSTVPMTESDSSDHYDRKDEQSLVSALETQASSSSGKRPVTFMQHEDGGRIHGDLGSPPQQVVELPPTYDAIQKS